jgi:hypothetical protein
LGCGLIWGSGRGPDLCFLTEGNCFDVVTVADLLTGICLGFCLICVDYLICCVCPDCCDCLISCLVWLVLYRMVVLVLGDLLLGVLLLTMIVLALLVLCLGTMVPIGTIDAWPVSFR